MNLFKVLFPVTHADIKGYFVWVRCVGRVTKQWHVMTRGENTVTSRVKVNRLYFNRSLILATQWVFPLFACTLAVRIT